MSFFFLLLVFAYEFCFFSLVMVPIFVFPFLSLVILRTSKQIYFDTHITAGTERLGLCHKMECCWIYVDNYEIHSLAIDKCCLAYGEHGSK